MWIYFKILGSNSTQQVPNSTAYDLRGPAKCTLESLVRFYAKRLAAKNVTVNCVIPGVVLTKAWKNITPANMETKDLVEKVTKSLPMKRPADAREIGAAIAFLCSDKARYITGVALSVDGGAHLGFWSNKIDYFFQENEILIKLILPKITYFLLNVKIL